MRCNVHYFLLRHRFWESILEKYQYAKYKVQATEVYFFS